MDEKTVEKIIDIADELKEPVKDIIAPASKQMGGALGVFTGFFNNVVLYPVRCLNATFEQKAIAFQRKVEEKYNKIPESNRTEVPVNILGPTLEGLKYNIDEEYMQEMYANLLAKSMDKTSQKNVHPKYASIIAQMNETDAKIFDFLFKKYKCFVLSGKVTLSVKNKNTYYPEALPEWVIEDEIENYDIFETSRALIRLSNLGLLDLMYDRSAGTGILEKLYQKKQIQDILSMYQSLNYNVELKGVDCIININDDGRNFAKIVYKE